MITVLRDECDFSLTQKVLKIWYVLAQHADRRTSYRTELKQFSAAPSELWKKNEEICVSHCFESSSQENIAFSISMRKSYWTLHVLRDAKSRQNFWIWTNSLYRLEQKGIVQFSKMNFKGYFTQYSEI